MQSPDHQRDKRPTDPTISVVIPVYNRRKILLSRSLPSVLNQTLSPGEIIIVNDGSTDGLALERLPSCDIPIRLLHQTNQGVSAARNSGIRAATGEWIAFLDSDDEWHPEKLKKQLNAIQDVSQNPHNAQLCHTAEHWILNGSKVKQPKHLDRSGDFIFEKCIQHCCIGPSTTIIHREIFEKIGLFDESLPACEDYDLWIRITAKQPVLFLDNALTTKYGGHDDQLSKSTAIIDQYRVRALVKAYKDTAYTENQRKQALGVAIERLNRIINGAKKRRNDETQALFEKQLNELLNTRHQVPK